MAGIDQGEYELARLLATMAAERQPGVFVFATLPNGAAFDMEDCVCWMREPEGLSVVMLADRLPKNADVFDYRAAWITLCVHSALAAVGLTAAVVTTLGNAGISCNVVAGARHDHLFVPETMADQVLACLQTLQARHAAASDTGASYQPQDTARS